MTSAMPIYYDLTEALLSASAKRVQYYGIARVVIETAREAALLDPNIRFVVFSFGKKAFYEIEWTRAADGSVEFQIAKDVGQRWFRTHFGGAGVIPLPPEHFLEPYDLILTSFPHFVPRFREMGIGSEYFRIGFDTRVLDILGKVEKDVPVSFVGGISRHHGKALPLFEYLAENTPIQFFGYGARTLPKSSPIRKRHNGEVWGPDMYRALARSRITLNRHINVAENNANNMRLYEATGVGSMLITDRKDNLGDLFEVGKEVVAYSSPEEAAELIRYYIDHPAEAEAIAAAGQARTLKEHTYRHRMEELVPILERYLKGER